MSLLADAVRELGLQPGDSYRFMIDGHAVEVRVFDNETTNELAEQGMLEPWIELPNRSLDAVLANHGPLTEPDSPDWDIDEDLTD